MQLIVNSRLYDDPPLFDQGGIATIYELEHGLVAKVFDDDQRQLDRKQKVLALCNSFENHLAEFGSAQFAFPEFPAYELEETFDNLVGFSMKGFGKLAEMGDLGFNFQAGSFLSEDGITLNDDLAIGLVYQIFELVDKLHKARIVLGDVNHRNVLYNPATRRPILIDLDSAQVGQFACIDVTPDFMAPELKKRGTTLAGGYIFDTGTDIFAVAAMCFEFLIGANPNYPHVSPPQSIEENRANGVSSIRCFVEGDRHLMALGLSYMRVPENRAVEERLKWLRSTNNCLFEFFVSVFVRNERTNLLCDLQPDDPRYPAHHFFLPYSGFSEVIGKIERERAQTTVKQVLTKRIRVSSALPDSGFRTLFGNSTAIPVPKSVSSEMPSKLRQKSDPPQLASFLRQFNLQF